MTTATITARQTALDLVRDARGIWAATTPRAQLIVRVSVLVGATLFAYHYSLTSLLQTLGFDTPLAYIGLVPIIAAVLAVAVARSAPPDPAIDDRHLDYIIGVPLITVALVINEIMPARQSVLFWLRRMDIVSIPFFVAGLVAILFGTRTLWKQKIPILYLFLAWPWPYTSILLGTLGSFTNITVSGLHAALHVFPVAKPIYSANGESGLFQISHHGHPFPVSVISACSGVDGMVGFLLVGAAFAAVVRGPRLRKAVWLAVGLVLLWTTNLARLIFIFWVGKNWGEHVALNVLHPIAGLVIFNIGTLLMVLLLRPFGLRIGRAGKAPEPEAQFRTTRNSPPVFLACGLIILASLALGISNESLKSFDPVASASGNARLASFLGNPAAPAGWSPIFTTEYTQNKTLFGETSRWFRYTFFYRGGGDLVSTLPVTADVINSGNVRSFGAYGVEACYDFHGFTLRDVADVSLADGINGQALSFATPNSGGWSIVYWVWPVKTGSQTRYERVILYLTDTTSGRVSAPKNVQGIHAINGALTPLDALDERLIVNRAFLTAFAREIIKAQVKVTPDPAPIGQIQPPVPHLPGTGTGTHDLVPSPTRTHT